MDDSDIESLRWAVNEVEKSVAEGFDRLIKSQESFQTKLLDVLADIVRHNERDSAKEETLLQATRYLELLVDHFMPSVPDDEFPGG